MIPKIIWQTYEQEFEELADYITETVDTWKIKNPDYEYRYASSDTRNKFVLDSFGQEWLDLFVGCPIPVMRADIWRYMVLYKVGGIYADIDTVCHKPADEWLPEDKDFVIAIENSWHFETWTIASAPNNPIILHVLNKIKNRLESITDYSAQWYDVHSTTGPAIWTEAIFEYLGYDLIGRDLINQLDDLNSYPSLIDNRVLVYDNKKLCGDFVSHLNASTSWTDKKDYRSWVDDLNNEMKQQK